MRVLAWGLGASAAAAVFVGLATAPAPPPQRFDLAWVEPLSAYVVQPRLYPPCGGPDATPGDMCCLPPQIEVHVEPAGISIFVSSYLMPPLYARRGRTQEARVATRLRTLRREEAFDGRTDIRIVPHDGVPYRDVVHVIELADRAGFGAISYVTPSGAIHEPTRWPVTF